MSTPAAGALRCVNCGRVIDACACCDQRDCPPPTCDRCLKEAILKTIRVQYAGSGASMSEGGEVSIPAFN
jgi:hypothetical protein